MNPLLTFPFKAEHPTSNCFGLKPSETTPFLNLPCQYSPVILQSLELDRQPRERSISSSNTNALKDSLLSPSSSYRVLYLVAFSGFMLDFMNHKKRLANKEIHIEINCQPLILRKVNPSKFA